MMMMMEANIRPQKMTRSDFRKSAVAVEREVGVWEVYLGHEALGSISAQSAAEALDDMHLRLVHQAIVGQATQKGTRDTSSLPSSAALADYPTLVVRYPRTVWTILERERSMQDSMLSKERQAIAGLVKLVEQLLKGRATKKEVDTLTEAALTPARLILDSDGTRSIRESSLESLMRQLLDGFDASVIKGGDELFELARALVESSGVPTFTTWMAGVESCVASDELDATAYRQLYDKGLSPSEAVLIERMGSGVVHH